MTDTPGTDGPDAAASGTPQIPVTVLRGLPESTSEQEAAVLTGAVARAIGTVVEEASTRYSDPREALRRHPRGAWGVPGATLTGDRWRTAFSPAGFRG